MGWPLSMARGVGIVPSMCLARSYTRKIGKNCVFQRRKLDEVSLTTKDTFGIEEKKVIRCGWNNSMRVLISHIGGGRVDSIKKYTILIP